MKQRTVQLIVLLISPITPLLVSGQHHTGKGCITCHNEFKVGGTVFTDTTAFDIASGVPLVLTSPDGGQVVLNPSDSNGRIWETIMDDGEYLISLGEITSRTWHNIPEQGSCNTCHTAGGNQGGTRLKTLPIYHTKVPAGNDCSQCHHFPATMVYDQLATSGVLSLFFQDLVVPESYVQIGPSIYPFNPDSIPVTTLRPDIFAPGFFSMFDVIKVVADSNDIPILFHFDSTRMTHFISSINGISADYWYHFSYDAGSGNSNEIQYRRSNRWDETLWRPGVWIKVVTGENVDELKDEYLQEITREKSSGHLIPLVRISVNPSDYQGNPSGSGRITVSKEFTDVLITPHNYRAAGYPTPYSKPFQPGVVTSMDIPLSLMDQGNLNAVTGVFYSYFAGHYINSYYIVEMGFPDVGIAHSSGRHGFVYTTGNGANFTLANEADNKMHITSDIAVLHSPDFSRWRWIELGNPYYESELTAIDPLIEQDFDAIERGFNLHPPFPNPSDEGHATIIFNMFDPVKISIQMVNISGVLVKSILDEYISSIGIHEKDIDLSHTVPGVYYIIMRNDKHMQIRKLVIL